MLPILSPEVRLLREALPVAPFTTSSAILPMPFRISFFIFLSPLRGKEGFRSPPLPLMVVLPLLCLSVPCRQVVEFLVEVIDLTFQDVFLVFHETFLFFGIRRHKGVAASGHTPPAHVSAITPTSPGTSSKAAPSCLRRIVGPRSVFTITISPSGLRTITHRSCSISSRHNVHLLSQNREFVLVTMK